MKEDINIDLVVKRLTEHGLEHLARAERMGKSHLDQPTTIGALVCGTILIEIADALNYAKVTHSQSWW